MSKVKELYLQATEDFKNLKSIVENHKGTFGELCTKLEGFDIAKKLYFTVKFNSINALVYYDFSTNKIEVCDDVKVWDEENSEFLDNHFYPLEEENNYGIR